MASMTTLMKLTKSSGPAKDVKLNQITKEGTKCPGLNVPDVKGLLKRNVKISLKHSILLSMREMTYYGFALNVSLLCVPNQVQSVVLIYHYKPFKKLRMMIPPALMN